MFIRLFWKKVKQDYVFSYSRNHPWMNDDQLQFNMNKLIPNLYKSKIRFIKGSIITFKIYGYLIIYKIKLCYKYLQIGKSKELN